MTIHPAIAQDLALQRAAELSRAHASRERTSPPLLRRAWMALIRRHPAPTAEAVHPAAVVSLRPTTAAPRSLPTPMGCAG